MELAFVVHAVRRYLWVVILCATLGALPGLLNARSASRYSSEAAMLLPPEDEIPGAPTERDRYLTGQLSVLSSESMAERVQDRLAEPLSIDEILSSVEFTQVAGSDVVVVSVSAGAPATAQAIANAYVDAYLEQLQDQVSAAVAPQREQLQARIEGLEGSLADIDTQLLQAMLPFLEAQPLPGSDSYPPIPSLEQVAPALTSSKAVLLSELAVVTTQLADLEVTTRDEIAGAAIQTATSPIPTVVESSRRLAIGGFVAGAFLGALVAVLLARISPRVAGDFEVEEILGDQLFGEMPRVRTFRTSLRAAFGALPDDVATFTNDICVRIGSNARDDVALTVMVAGTRRRAGTSTLAAAIAARFAMNGANVLLLDADLRHPQLSTLRFDAGDNSVSSDSASFDAPRTPTAEGQPSSPSLLGPIRSTPLGGVRIARFNNTSAAAPMRRQSAVDLLEFASSMAEVVVIDGGPLLESATTIQLGRATATLVLAIPRHETARSLAAVAKELRNRSVLAVWTPSRRKLLALASRAGDVAPTVDSSDDQDSSAAARPNSDAPTPAGKIKL